MVTREHKEPKLDESNDQDYTTQNDLSRDDVLRLGNFFYAENLLGLEVTYLMDETALRKPKRAFQKTLRIFKNSVKKSGRNFPESFRPSADSINTLTNIVSDDEMKTNLDTLRELSVDLCYNRLTQQYPLVLEEEKVGLDFESGILQNTPQSYPPIFKFFARRNQSYGQIMGLCLTKGEGVPIDRNTIKQDLLGLGIELSEGRIGFNLQELYEQELLEKDESKSGPPFTYMLNQGKLTDTLRDVAKIEVLDLLPYPSSDREEK